jgi:hypothetical protein
MAYAEQDPVQTLVLFRRDSWNADTSVERGAEDDNHIYIVAHLDGGEELTLMIGPEEAAQLVRNLAAVLVGSRPLLDFNPEV